MICMANFPNDSYDDDYNPFDKVVNVKPLKYKVITAIWVFIFIFSIGLYGYGFSPDLNRIMISVAVIPIISISLVISFDRWANLYPPQKKTDPIFNPMEEKDKTKNKK